MTTTNHALTGALIATIIKQPLLAIPLAFLSHFVCDVIPHFGMNSKFGSRQMFLYLGLDGGTAVLVALFLISQGVHNPLLLAVSGFAAMSPDLAWLYYGLKNGDPNDEQKQDRFTQWHGRIQKFEKPIGIIPELIWASLCVTLILKLQ